MESMTFCIGKEDGRVYRIYDITYDKSGFPSFLIYDGESWIRKSAKFFIPAEVMVPDEEFDDEYDDDCDADCPSCGHSIHILQ